MVKHTEEKVKMVEKPEDAEIFYEFKKIIVSNKKSSFVSVLSRYNISHFEEVH